MAVDTANQIVIVGAGPVGCVLAALLARRGVDVATYEKRPDMRRTAPGGGRSINLVLTDRGLQALEYLELRQKVLALTVPVRGRMMHSPEGELTFQPYGKDESECNFSVSRDRLNQCLLDAAEEAGAELHFEHEFVDADFSTGTLQFRHGGETVTVESETLFGCDGAPSAVRTALVEQDHAAESVRFMEWGYRELLFPAGPDGSYQMEKNALHIWPRGDHFLMGLANVDGSFTGTLYLPRSGPNSFDELSEPDRLRAFFDEYYTDATELLGDFVDTFLEHPTGTLGTVRCAPWNLDGRVLLVGDAAHGIVPFFGQGLNSGFEDCVVLDELLDHSADFGDVFQRFYERRKPNTDAIADMALENAVEMGEKVADSEFLMQKQVESVLERHLADRYRSRYAIVMYSRIPYRVAFEIGEHQKDILRRLADGLDDPEDVDLELARHLIDDQLQPLYERHGVDLDF